MEECASTASTTLPESIASYALMVSSDHMEYHQNPLQDAYPVGVTSGLQPDVKWGLEGASVNHNLLEKTVMAVLMDTITTPSASNIQCTRAPLNPPLVLLWIPPLALWVILAHPTVSSVCATTEEQYNRCVMGLDAVCAAMASWGRDATAVNKDTTLSQVATLVSVMELV